MKAIRAILLLLALGLSVYGQAVGVKANKIKGSATAPSGACSAQDVQLTTAGVLWTCASGTWTSSGGGTTINSTNGALPYRVNATTFGDSAFASNALNSTYLQATSGASGAGVILETAGGGTNEHLIFRPKGLTGQIRFQSSGGIVTHAWIDSSGSLFYINGMSLNLDWNARIKLGNSGTLDVGLSRLSAGVIRVDNTSTGAGQLLIGTSTDTADAQLSVYSQSTTRPGLKLNMPSGTSGSQEAFGNYDNGTRNLYITAAGTILYATDNAVDIGASGANRPRNVYVAGTVTGGALSSADYINVGNRIDFTGKARIKSSADGLIELFNAAESGFTRLNFGGTSASFPSIKRNGATLEFRLADDSANANITTGIITSTGYVEAASASGFRFTAAGNRIYSGTGSPESVLSAVVGSMYLRTDGGASTTLYIKESGTGNTGWVAK